jgi:hypothetical protein
MPINFREALLKSPYVYRVAWIERMFLAAVR